jgi:hypothetical protein
LSLEQAQLMKRFRIDVLDAQGALLGMIGGATEVAITGSVDKLGEGSFTMAAGDSKSHLVGAGRRYAITDEEDGPLGTFRHRDYDVTGAGMLTVQMDDALVDLTNEVVGFERSYDDVPVEDVVGEIVGILPGWAASVQAGLGNTTVAFNGETIFAALAQPATVEFGTFGEASGVRLTNARAAFPADDAGYSEVGFVPPGGITFHQDAAGIVNSVIPFGAGNGMSALNIMLAEGGQYAVRFEGQLGPVPFYYIQDDESVAEHGRIRRIWRFGQIRPINNLLPNVVAAATWLKFTAETLMKRRLWPQVTYDVAPVRLQPAIDAQGRKTQAVRVGQTVHLLYKGEVNSGSPDAHRFIDADAHLFVTDITVTRRASGEKTVGFSLSSNGERRASDIDVLVEEIKTAQAFRVHPQAGPSKSVYNFSKGRLGDGVKAAAQVTIGPETMRLHYAKLRFVTSPLKSSVREVADGGGTLLTSAGGGNHRHTMFDFVSSLPGGYSEAKLQAAKPGGGVVYVDLKVSQTQQDLMTYEATGNHIHPVDIPQHKHAQQYGPYQDTTYPAGVRLKVNGLDVTAALGGPWDTGGEGASVELDVTSLMAGAVGGLQRTHTFEFSCDGGHGEIDVQLTTFEDVQSIVLT